IKSAAESDAPMIRLFSLLAACFANDAKGIKIVEKRLKDSNSLLRGAAIQLSASLPDLKIQNELLRLMKEEPLFLIRLEAIKALRNSKYPHVKEELEKRLLNNQLEHEERALVIQSLVRISEKAKRQEIETLSKSTRVQRRLLAAEFVLEQELVEEIDLILPLLSDNRREVRKAALQTIGSWRIQEVNGQDIAFKIEPLLNDLDQTVAITAAWALSLKGKEIGKKELYSFVNHPSKEVQLQASSAIGALGSSGMPLMRQAFLEASDPLIKMNLAIGLIGQRQLLKEASSALDECLIAIKEPLKWVENGSFKYLATSQTQEAESIPDERQAKNQLARLEIVNILSILNDPKAEDALKTFLQQNTWGISAMASLLLLTEADESAIHLVEHLLDDPSKKVRVQAALILSL
ncbi:MAG TPA: hypothetical protein PLC42_02770, partial [Parachlamydiaceae bacterium]|nr:hypothetical protein [Parachlamydiaceae bacterium]